MKNIIETSYLESLKSDFRIDLVKHNKGKLYVEISQTINESNYLKPTIKINPIVLSDFIKILQNYEATIVTKYDNLYNYISDNDQKKIQDRYLKGVMIKDLEMQFNISTELIEMILRNRNIEIVPNDLSKVKVPWKKYWRKNFKM